ncbi:hypothetical protein Btru_044197 [Bulinus truncatus]|nr:hypothetical protein Btru_044197 [Bulinus truncatus]
MGVDDVGEDSKCTVVVTVCRQATAVGDVKSDNIPTETSSRKNCNADNGYVRTVNTMMTFEHINNADVKMFSRTTEVRRGEMMTSRADTLMDAKLKRGQMTSWSINTPAMTCKCQGQTECPRFESRQRRMAFRAEVLLCTEDVILATEEVLLAIEDVLRPTDDVLLATGDVLLATDHVLLATEDVLLAIDDVFLATEDS